jgi:hypothetical protein
MAKQTITTLIDDLDGSEANESILFTYRGAAYSIDLNEKNAAAFDKAMARYVRSGARVAPQKSSARTSAASAGRRTDLAQIRIWAAEQGWQVSSRGRISSDVLDAYDAAH